MVAEESLYVSDLDNWSPQQEFTTHTDTHLSKESDEAVMAGPKQPNRGITAKIRVYFEMRPGTVVFLKDLTGEFRVEEVLIMQVMANLARLGTGYQVHIKTQAWIFRPEGTNNTGKLMFEQVAVLKSGELLLQDTDGNVYRAMEL